MALVSCGCGGKPEHEVQVTSCGRGKPTERHYISCKKCLILCGADSYEKAEKIWNTAMSGNRVIVHNVVFGDNQRTAKVDAGHKSVITGTLMDGHCECGCYVQDDENYCPECGALLLWG